MSDVTIDASELTSFGRRIAAAHAKASIAVAKAVKKGAQNVKESIQEDVAGSGNAGIRKVADIFRSEISTNMALLGCRTLADVTPDLIAPVRAACAA